jgi:hypothetical protein
VLQCGDEFVLGHLGAALEGAIPGDLVEFLAGEGSVVARPAGVMGGTVVESRLRTARWSSSSTAMRNTVAG